MFNSISTDSLQTGADGDGDKAFNMDELSCWPCSHSAVSVNTLKTKKKKTSDSSFQLLEQRNNLKTEHDESEM